MTAADLAVFSAEEKSKSKKSLYPIKIELNKNIENGHITCAAI